MDNSDQVLNKIKMTTRKEKKKIIQKGGKIPVHVQIAN